MKNFKNKQQGATLIVAILFLLVITVLGISSWQLSSGEERMAGLTRDRQLAYEAAEAALRDGEMDLRNECAPPGGCAQRASGFDKERGFPDTPSNSATPVACDTQGLCTAPRDPMGRQIGQVPAAVLRCGLNGPTTVCPNGQSVTYGRFTRLAGTPSSYQFGSTGAAAQRLAFPPRYTLQVACLSMASEGTGTCKTQNIYYVVTGIGFGQRPGTEVVLQSFYQLE